MATALDPKSTSIPGSGPPLLWPAMNMQTQSTMRFRAGEGASRLESSGSKTGSSSRVGGNVVESGVYRSRCAFWDSTGYDWLE